jgi:hypothetical protein
VVLVVDADQVLGVLAAGLVEATVEGRGRRRRERVEGVLERDHVHREEAAPEGDVRQRRGGEPEALGRGILARAVHQPEHLLLPAVRMLAVRRLVEHPLGGRRARDAQRRRGLARAAFEQRRIGLRRARRALTGARRGHAQGRQQQRETQRDPGRVRHGELSFVRV